METAILATLALIALIVLAAILNMQKKILQEIKNIKFPKPPPPPPPIEIPPAKEVILDLNPVIEAIKNIHIPEPKEIEIPPSAAPGNVNTDTLQEIAALMRVNQAEFQSGLEAFHKAIEKLLNQIPTGDKEVDIQKEFMQRFEEAFVKVQEKAAEAISENSLRLQEILTEVLNKEAK